MPDDDQRPVSYPSGETTFTEFVLRRTYADGTVTDSEPRRKPAKASTLGQAVGKMARSMAANLGGSLVRLERTVTVVAGEWRVIPDDQPAAEVAPNDPGNYCRRLLCGHGRRHHAAVSTELEGHDAVLNVGSCGVCGNTEKCPSFVGNEEPEQETKS